MLYTDNTLWEYKYKNRHHFSKETLASLHSAHVVVQGSPLLVRIFLKLSNVVLYVMQNCRTSFTPQHIG